MGFLWQRPHLLHMRTSRFLLDRKRFSDGSQCVPIRRPPSQASSAFLLVAGWLIVCAVALVIHAAAYLLMYAGAVYKLYNPFDVEISYWSIVTYLLDQTAKGALFDVMEVFKIAYSRNYASTRGSTGCLGLSLPPGDFLYRRLWWLRACTLCAGYFTKFGVTGLVHPRDGSVSDENDTATKSSTIQNVRTPMPSS